MQRDGVGACCGSQVIYLRDPGCKVLSDPEGHDDMNAPRSAEIAQRPDVYLASPGHTRTSLCYPHQVWKSRFSAR